jgi:hypothetical protein
MPKISRVVNKSPLYVWFLSWQGAVTFKFGVLYCKEGQTAETEMFSNGMHLGCFGCETELFQG